MTYAYRSLKMMAKLKNGLCNRFSKSELNYSQKIKPEFGTDGEIQI